MSIERRLFVCSVAALISSCGAPAAVGEACVEHMDCESEYCVDGVCVVPCDASGEECATGICAGGVLGGVAYCVSECDSLTTLRLGYFCASGVPTTCDEAGPGVDCRVCPCSPGQDCDIVTNRCTTPAEVGAPCSVHRECASNNCGNVGDDAPICFPAAGEPCDGANCGECVNLPDGGTECVRACDDSADCGGAEDETLCWGRTSDEDQGFYCRAPCVGSGPGSCRAGYTCRTVRDREFRSYERCFPESTEDGPARQ